LFATRLINCDQGVQEMFRARRSIPILMGSAIGMSAADSSVSVADPTLDSELLITFGETRIGLCDDREKL
jgi:hypothetical protein